MPLISPEYRCLSFSHLNFRHDLMELVSIVGHNFSNHLIDNPKYIRRVLKTTLKVNEDRGA